MGVEPGMIAKTMSFLQDDQPILILTEGTARVENRKYKDTFHIKAKMIPFEEVEQWIGHAPGGVCPFGINDGVKVYLDESLRRFETVYPAAGDDAQRGEAYHSGTGRGGGSRWVGRCLQGNSVRISVPTIMNCKLME